MSTFREKAEEAYEIEWTPANQWDDEDPKEAFLAGAKWALEQAGTRCDDEAALCPHGHSQCHATDAMFIRQMCGSLTARDLDSPKEPK